MDRRGDLTATELVAILVILVSTVVLYLVIARVRVGIAGAADLTCAEAVRQANFQNEVLGRDNALEIQSCQTRDITIRRQDLPADFTKADLEVKHDLAEQMRLCWRDWGEGNMDLFNSTGTYCQMCAAITFDDALKADYRKYSGGQIRDFGKYLSTTPMYPGTSETYADYLTGHIRGSTQTLATPTYYLPADKGLVIMYSQDRMFVDGTTTQKLFALFGKDLTPGDQGAIGGIAGGSLAAASQALELAGGAAAAFAGSAPFLGALAAAPPFGWIALGVIGVVGAGVAAADIYGAVKETAQVATATSAISYFYARYKEQWQVTSAIYITYNSADNPYVKSCTAMASTTVSP